MTRCKDLKDEGKAPVTNDSWNFDEVVDRSGTWSIKYGRASEGQIPMWIADMDFRTAPAVSSALKERLNRDVLGYTYTPEEFYQSIIHWEKEMHMSKRSSISSPTTIWASRLFHPKPLSSFGWTAVRWGSSRRN